MKLEGIHHVTCITADAPGNVDFYARVLGLRLVKKTVNQDDPTVYHLFYADERGSAGADITFFEYPGIPRGRAGAGMVHLITFRVGSEAALDFWAERLGGQGVETERGGAGCGSGPGGPPARARRRRRARPAARRRAPDIPREHAIQGFDNVRTYSRAPSASAAFLEQGLGFEPRGDNAWELRGDRRGGRYAYDEAPESAASAARHRAPRRLGVAAGGARGVAAARRLVRRVADAGDRPLLLQVGLLPRAERRALRAGDDRPGLHHGRAARDARGAAFPAAALRAPPRRARAGAHAAARTSGRRGR